MFFFFSFLNKKKKEIVFVPINIALRYVSVYLIPFRYTKAILSRKIHGKSIGICLFDENPNVINVKKDIAIGKLYGVVVQIILIYQFCINLFFFIYLLILSFFIFHPIERSVTTISFLWLSEIFFFLFHPIKLLWWFDSLLLRRNKRRI